LAIAYVLVDAEVGKVRGILGELRKAEGVAEAYSVSGQHDIVVKIEAEKFEQVAEKVTQKLHKIGGIKSTSTLFAFE
jgi:DNA-binding Lrp family transcriptional regulator